jgi:hypothetical protein
MAITLVEFTPTSNKKEFKKFIDLSWKIYAKDPAWVPPLRLTVLDALDTKKNPFYLHAKIMLWNAYKDGEHVGRIAGIVDEVHNKFHSEQTAFFGFFECTDDAAASEALFAAVEKWGKAQGMKVMRGPANPSLNHEAGLLLDNFGRAPYIMMTHNPAYYAKLIEKQNYTKAKDLLAFEMPTSQPFPEKYVRIAQKVAEKNEITFRSINMKNFLAEVRKIQEVYNDAWEKNWGFVPMDDAEFKHMAKSLKDVIWPEFCLIAERNGEAIGFSLALPDINQVLKDIPNGKLLPFGIFTLLSGLNPKKKKVTQLRVITLGVKQKYRASGVAGLFYVESYNRARAMGIERGEMSWILEDNQLMLGAIQSFAGVPPYKTYRLYDKAL